MSRRNRWTRLSGAIVVLGLFATAAVARESTAGDECGTVLSPEGAQLGIERELRGDYLLDSRDVGPLQVRMAVHVVRTDAGTGGLQEQEVANSLEKANEDFAPLGISFVLEGEIDYIDSDAFFYDIDTLAEIDQLRETNVVDHALNVYFTENLANQSGFFCGISSFTWSPHQGVVLMNACIPAIWNPSTFTHELGHYFDLFHTHETAYGYECVDGSNCATAGDRICDTPADPRLNRCGVNGNDHCLDPYCVYTGAFLDPCHADPYEPSTDNFLAYSRASCRTAFTAEQSAKAAATLVNLRADHIIDTTGFEDEEVAADAGAAPLLRATVQNPVSERIACRLSSSEDQLVAARLLDASGRTVTRLLDDTLSAGTHGFQWDLDRRLPSGIYFLQIDSRPRSGAAGDPTITLPIVVVR